MNYKREKRRKKKRRTKNNCPLRAEPRKRKRGTKHAMFENHEKTLTTQRYKEREKRRMLSKYHIMND